MRSRVKRKIRAAVLLLPVFLVACGREASVPPEDNPRRGSEINWSAAPPDTIPLNSIAEAASYVGFSPLAPRIGDPDAIYVSDPATMAADEPLVILVYLRHIAAPFWIEQMPTGPNWRDNFDELVAQCQPPECQSKLSVVTIRGGTRALFIDDGDISLILWREGDVEVRVKGPSSSFNTETAVEIANSV